MQPPLSPLSPRPSPNLSATITVIVEEAGLRLVTIRLDAACNLRLRVSVVVSHGISPQKAGDFVCACVMWLVFI